MGIKEEAYHFLRKLTSQHQRERLKGRISRFRGALSPILTRWYGTFGNDELEAALHTFIPPDFEILMVHSSISNMQPIYQGTAKDLLNLLLRIVGTERTLAMPAFYFGTPKLFNRAYYIKHPRFDARRTPSQMGVVTELFRRRAGVVRSLHPTHSVCALGMLAEELCATHHQSPWACGELSPFGMMGRRRTTIIGLGVEYYRSLTQVHSMEEILAHRFPVPRELEDPVHVELVDKDGKVIHYKMSPPLSRDFVLRAERLREFLSPGDMKQEAFRGVPLYVTEASKVDAGIRGAALRGRTLYQYSPRK